MSEDEQFYLGRYSPFIDLWSSAKDPMKLLEKNKEKTGGWGVRKDISDKTGGKALYDPEFYSFVLPMLIAMLEQERTPIRDDRGKLRTGVTGREAREKYISDAEDRARFGLKPR